MGKRGPSGFKRNDAVRAIQSGRDARLEPTMFEIVAKDGTTNRVYGDKAALRARNRKFSASCCGRQLWCAPGSKIMRCIRQSIDGSVTPHNLRPYSPSDWGAIRS